MSRSRATARRPISRTRPPARPRRYTFVWTSMSGGRRAADSGLRVGLEPIDYFIQSLGLNFRSEVGSEALDVRDALDDDVPGLPDSVGFPQAEVHRDLIPGLTLHFG